ncbi:MAG: hypothetical protein K5924_00840 [Chloroflexi bacterium]|nr:hypothetical protein [Chloroflexota bacterium]
MDSFGGIREPRPTQVDLLTDAYRVTGVVMTRFQRITDILNQLSGSHLTVSQATISEHADPSATTSAPSVSVDTAAILVLAAPDLSGGASAEMRIPKRAVRAQLAIPPLRCTGKVHIAQGSRPLDGLLNVTDRFLPMTEVTIESGAFPQLARTAEVVAIARSRAQLLLVMDDENPDELLADVLDQRTAEVWLRSDEDAQG